MSTCRNGSRVRLCDLSLLFEPDRSSYLDTVERVLSSGTYILGEEVAQFEREFAAYLGCRFAVGVGSGTDAIELALRALDIGPRGVVFTASHTSVAVVSAIERAGATPFLCDVSADTFTLSPESLLSAIDTVPSGLKARAIVPVHLYGHPAPMRDLCSIAAKHGLAVVEDCAQSHGSRIADHMCGTFGQLAAFSFYPTKNLGAFGDAGCVVTDDSAMNERLRQMRQYGWKRKQFAECRGICSRLDELQASLLRVRLGVLDQHNEARRKIAWQYDRCLSRTRVSPPHVEPSYFHTYHQYVVKCADRDQLSQWLSAHRIDSAVHYPVPIHLQPGYANVLVDRCGLANTEHIVRHILSIPIQPALSRDTVSYVCGCLADYNEM